VVRLEYLSSMGPEGGLGREALSADVAVEGSVLEPLELALVIAQVLLKIRQLEKQE